MKVTIDLPDSNFSTGFQFKWEPGFQIRLSVSGNEVAIVANKEGLISLANQFLLLAQDAFQNWYHIHLDELNSLEKIQQRLFLKGKISFSITATNSPCLANP